MSNQTPSPKPTDAEQESGKGLDGTPCSGSWILVNDADPASVPQHPGHYLVACEGGNVTESFYVCDLKWYGETRLPARKWNGKYSRRFEVAQRGYKITHWMPIPSHPNAKGDAPGAIEKP